MFTVLSGLLHSVVVLFLRTSNGNSFPPPLSAEEERRCFQLCKSGDKEARDKLILHNLRLVAHIIKKYYTGYKDQDDLISIGTIGLIKAIDSFDIDKGARFATYAGKCLQNEILMYFRSQKKLQNETSIHESVDTDKDGNPLTYFDIIRCDDNIADEIDKRIRLDVMNKAIASVLTNRERKIILLRYGLGECNEPLAQREVAKMLGISRSYVSRIEKSALEKLEKYMRDHGLGE